MTVERIADPLETAAAAPKRQPLIALDGVGKIFTTAGGVSVHALREVCLEIAAGEFVAIMGQSGSGKSTLMNILGCLDRCTEGHYRVEGQDVSDLDRDQLALMRRSVFGFVFQSYNLIPSATALENVEMPAVYAGFPPAVRHERAKRLLASVGLEDRLNHRPNQMSGGEQQRTAIARAMMNSGRVVLADEPTGALDSATGLHLMEFLESLSTQGHTIIIITHDRSVASHAHRIVELRDGRILSDRRTDKLTGLSVPPGPRIVEASAYERQGRLGDALRTASRALRRNLLRTLLTLLGIMIGVASVIAMSAVGEGSKQRILQRVSALGDNLINIFPGAPNQRFGEGGAVKSLTIEDGHAISELPNVDAVIPLVSSSYTARAGRNDYRTQVTATGHDFPKVRRWEVESGVFFSRDDEIHHRAVAVIGKAAAGFLFPDGRSPLGATIIVNNMPFTIIGTLPSRGASASGGFDQDSNIFIPVTTGYLRLSGQRHVQSITAAVLDTATLAETEDAIKDLLRRRHRVEDFQVRNLSMVIQMVTATQDSMKLLLAVVAGISLLVGGIGIMNVMLMSVTERTREIGIRVACGASSRDIREQFMTEAFAISAFGGVLGIVLGLATIATLSAYAVPVVYQLWPIFIAFCCALVTGLVFSITPAVKASRLDPVAALAGK